MWKFNLLLNLVLMANSSPEEPPSVAPSPTDPFRVRAKQSLDAGAVKAKEIAIVAKEKSKQAFSVARQRTAEFYETRAKPAMGKAGEFTKAKVEQAKEYFKNKKPSPPQI